MYKIKFSLIALLIMFSLAVKPQSGSPKYKIVNKFHVPGDGGWDYLKADELTGRLYLSHGTVVQVIDSKTGSLLGTINDTKGVHGIALATDLNKGFISNGKDTSVTIFNIKTLEFISKVHVTGNGPDGILYDRPTQRVFVFNGKSNNATVLDAKTGRVIETVLLSGKPEASVTDEKGNIYLNLEDVSKIVVINAVTMKVEKEWSLGPGEEPTGIALDNENHILFAVCHNKMAVIVNALTGKVINTLPIGEKPDGIEFDPGLKRAYSSNGMGTITVIEEKSKTDFRVLETIPTQMGAKTITIDRKTHHLYLPAADFKASGEENTKPKVVPGTFVVLDVSPNP